MSPDLDLVIHERIHTYTLTYTLAYIHTYIHTHTHTHTHLESLHWQKLQKVFSMQSVVETQEMPAGASLGRRDKEIKHLNIWSKTREQNSRMEKKLMTERNMTNECCSHRFCALIWTNEQSTTNKQKQFVVVNIYNIEFMGSSEWRSLMRCLVHACHASFPPRVQKTFSLLKGFNKSTDFSLNWL